MLQVASARVTGHPTWHYLVVALAAIAVFIGIKVHEYRQAHPARVRAGRQGLLVFVALSSAGAAAIHASVCPAHFREALAFGVFFVVASAFQAGWAIGVWLRPTRARLRLGVAANTAIIAVWAISRTTGLPFGPEIWHAESISLPDVIATLHELSVVVGAWLLCSSPLRAHATLQHEADPVGVGEQRDVGERITANRNDVGELARLERADRIFASQEPSRREGGGRDRLERGHAAFDHEGQLT
jgi:hypothetical protein